MSFLDLDVGMNREGGNISGTSVELVKMRLKKGTRKTRSDKSLLVILRLAPLLLGCALPLYPRTVTVTGVWPTESQERRGRTSVPTSRHSRFPRPPLLSAHSTCRLNGVPSLPDLPPRDHLRHAPDERAVWKV